MIPRHLFVYGTFKPGHCRWPVLEQFTDGDPIPDSVDGELFDTGAGFPAAVIGSDGSIPGFTVPLDTDSLTLALEAFDRIEGVGFTRMTTVTRGQVTVWVYSWAWETDDLISIASWEYD